MPDKKRGDSTDIRAGKNITGGAHPVSDEAGCTERIADTVMGIFQVLFLNVQGLTQSKLIEIEKEVINDKTRIICLVEMHQLRDNLYFSNNIGYTAKYRNEDDKKGGGILLLWNKNLNNIRVEQTENNNSDILTAKVKIADVKFYLVITYAATNDDHRNVEIYKELQNQYDAAANGKILFVGDFNGHIGLVGPQPINKNGRKLLLKIYR